VTKTWRKALEWGLLCGLALLLFIIALVFAEEKYGTDSILFHFKKTISS
jgi:hypothetical protein